MLGGGSLTGLEAVFHHGAFDLASSPTITGEDTFEDASGSYNLVSLNLQAIEYKFLADTGGQYYHVRVPFVHPKPSNDATFSGCGWGGGLDEADEFGTFWDGSVAEPTDILVCIRATADATCTDAEFQWVNGTALTSTRPVSPKQVSDGGHLMTASTCSREATWGSTSIDVGLSAGVEATASFGDGGVKTYTVGSSTGTVLTATIDFDLTDGVFVPDSSLAIDLSAATQAQVLGAIDKILPKPIYLNSVKTTGATEVDGLFQASATLSVE